ncbi:hypothetical protein FHX64_000642 [Microbacter margulisiae]|uniref:Uncharacterized protein n=1 Tax=Microbacter margulisiae TaxID=1350067 RepID=A0A7W5DP31_9PORP|nr:hypothetical protein [Microbacter margulisiae]
MYSAKGICLYSGFLYTCHLVSIMLLYIRIFLYIAVYQMNLSKINNHFIKFFDKLTVYLYLCGFQMDCLRRQFGG